MPFSPERRRDLRDPHIVPGFEVMQIFPHDAVAAAGKRRIRLADDRGIDRALVGRILHAVDETPQVALVVVLKPWTSSTAATESPSLEMICVASSKQRSGLIARMWNRRSPWVDTA